LLVEFDFSLKLLPLDFLAIVRLADCGVKSFALAGGS
jgi:hypothetical protein